MSILRARIGSQAGLAISFSLGFIAGTAPRREAGESGEKRTRRRPGRLSVAVMDSAAKLLAAMIAKSLASSRDGVTQGDTPQEP